MQNRKLYFQIIRGRDDLFLRLVGRNHVAEITLLTYQKNIYWDNLRSSFMESFLETLNSLSDTSFCIVTPNMRSLLTKQILFASKPIALFSPRVLSVHVNTVFS